MAHSDQNYSQLLSSGEFRKGGLWCYKVHGSEALWSMLDRGPSAVQAKESFAKMQPPEVRILKHLLSIDSPAQRAEEMRGAFTPGPELETEQQDFLHT